MSVLTFRVRGQHRLLRAPERAVVHLGVRAEEADAQSAATVVRQVASEVRTDLASRAEIEEVNVGQFRIWSEPGSTADAPTREVAEAEIRVTVTDFTELGELLLTLGSVPQVNVGWIDWQLSDQARRETEREARKQALLDARGRAEDYASALGVGDLVTVLVADGGMLHATAGRMAFAAKEGGAGDEFFTPQEIEVTAEVEVEYTAAGN